MKILGVTGPTGSGKSTFSRLAEECGFFVINADEISRKVTDGNNELLSQLSTAFGKEIIAPDGTLNRKRLAAAAFRDSESKNRLESLMFPHIRRLIAQNIIRAEKDGYHYLLLDAPTLYESGTDAFCDRVSAVLCDRAVGKERIISRDKISDYDADIRQSAGKPDEFYFSRADYIIRNNGGISEFREKCRAVIKKFKEETADEQCKGIERETFLQQEERQG